MNGWLQELNLFPTLAGYRRQWLARDLLAGITFGAVTIPGQIATAHLAGMPPITGLYGFLASCLMAAVFAVNRHLALGMDSTVAPILASGLVGLGMAAGSPEYMGAAITTTFVVGFLAMVVGVGKMGWFGDFLSRPVVIGFLGGIAIIITINQLPGLFGVESGSGSSLSKVRHFVGQVPNVNVWSLAIGVTSLVLLLVIAKLNRRFPGALIVLTLATLSVVVFGLQDKGVAVLGPLKQGLPSIVIPDLSFDNIRLIIGTALAVLIICLAQTSATTRSAAAIGGFETDINGDYRALGAANLLSSFFGAFTADASPPSTTIIGESRGRTQVTSLVAAVLVVVLLFASFLAQDLPMATLSAVLIYIAIRIFHVDEMRACARYSWRAVTLMLVTMISVVTLGIIDGVGLAVLISFIDRARRTARPELLELGRTLDGQWLPTMDLRSLKVFRIEAFLLNGPLWFGNASWFRQQLIDAIPEGSNKPDVLVLDATRMDDIDFTGADCLVDVAEICHLRDVQFAIAAHRGRVEEAFERGGLLDQIGEDHFFDSVEQAVQTLAPQDTPGLN